MTTTIEVVATLPWDDDDGVPGSFEPVPHGSVLGPDPVGSRRVGALVRVGPDDAIEVLAVRSGRSRLARLAPRQVVDLEGAVIDARIGPDGSVVVLRSDAGAPHLVSIAPSGAVTWSWTGAVDIGQPRLLVGPPGACLAGQDGAITVIDGRVASTMRWAPGGDPVLSADGRIAFVRWDESRNVRDVVLLDPVSGRESITTGTEDSVGFLTRLIGVDRAGRAYGFSAGELGRLTPDGRVDWRLRLPAGLVRNDGEDVEMSSLTGGFGGDGVETRRLLAPADGAVTADGRVVVASLTAGGLQVLTVGRG